MRKLRLIPTLGVMALGACAGGESGPDDFGYEGTGIAVSVAPLTLDSLSDACYSFTVVNGDTDLVVGRGPEAADLYASVTGTAARSVCASQFGNGDGGDASYVAPCDADAPDHTVTLWVDALCASGSPGADPGGLADTDTVANGGICDQIQDYVDPCPTGCSLPVVCVENADTPVTFNFTIMGQADQGFFDIAVNFDDIFCSAKVDCTNTAGEDIKLLFGRDGERHETMVLAFACTAGENADTHLYMDNVTVTCEDNVGSPVLFPVKPWLGEGNVHAFNLNAPPPNGLYVWGPPPTPVYPFPSWLPLDFAGEPYATTWRPLFQSANYKGVEYLGDWNKVYWNLAMGIYMPGFGESINDSDQVNRCYLNTTLSASNGPLVNNGYPSDPNTTYPAISVRVPLNPTGSVAKLDCGQHPLDGDGSGVQTVYSQLNAPWCFNFWTSADFTTGEVTTGNINSNAAFGDANCMRYGAARTFNFYDVNANGTYEEGVDLPSGIMQVAGPGLGVVRSDTNGNATFIANASFSMGNSLSAVYHAGFAADPCPTSPGSPSLTVPASGFYPFYNPQGGNPDALYYFGYTCGTPAP